MENIKRALLLVISAICSFSDMPIQAQNRNVMEADVCIYGGTCAGVIAAYTAKRMGKTVILIEPGKHLGE